jgi:hypothetical protein
MDAFQTWFSALQVIRRCPTRIFDMEKPLSCFLAVVAVATAILGASAPAFARGGAASIMNSPGYQRRLQESRQQASQPDVQPASLHHKPGHQHRH